jgi:hypothetical protein
MDILPTLEGVDCVVADPPYGIGFKYESHDDSPDGYGEWLWGIMEQTESLCGEGAPIFVFQAMANIRKFHKWFPREWRIFAACKNFVQMRPIAMQYAYDPVVVWWKEGERYSKGTANRDYFIANTAPVVANTKNIERQHPCPRPLDQMKHIIEQWCAPRSTILDPFMGSGTTGVACARLGRKFIGIEIEERYFKIACERIQREYDQLKMF